MNVSTRDLGRTNAAEALVIGVLFIVSPERTWVSRSIAIFKYSDRPWLCPPAPGQNRALIFNWKDAAALVVESIYHRKPLLARYSREGCFNRNIGHVKYYMNIRFADSETRDSEARNRASQSCQAGSFSLTPCQEMSGI
jgi:hypothetical protein